MTSTDPQLDLFAQPTIEEATARRDAAIQQVEDNADEDWKTLAWDTLCEYLCEHDEFFVDDFWKNTGLPRPREARALGAIVTRAARANYMEKTGEYRPSVASNMTAKPVWRSLVVRA